VSTESFTLDDLKRVLRESAGVDETVDLDGDILDTAFTDLGYESLALLETCGHIERDLDISLDDSLLGEALTPRALVEAVNAQLGTVRA
jgi:minimal PKS acyl carrier protein